MIRQHVKDEILDIRLQDPITNVGPHFCLAPIIEVTGTVLFAEMALAA